MENLFIPNGSRSGTAFSDYLAIGIAEGFEDFTDSDLWIEAWATIGQRGLHRSLQGFFGRNLSHLKEFGVLNQDYSINWEVFDDQVAVF
jgi:hypothetical protein